VPGSNLTGDQNSVIVLVLYQELRVSCTVGARISKRPRYGQVRHRVSSGVVVQVWRPRNQPSCPLPAPRPANLHFRVRAVQAILTWTENQRIYAPTICELRPTWTQSYDRLLYKFLNEILEELALAVFGRWALVDTVANLEPRYDILIKDCVLVAVPICAVACHFVYAIRLLDPLEGPPL